MASRTLSLHIAVDRRSVVVLAGLTLFCGLASTLLAQTPPRAQALDGVWDFRTATPLQRPRALEGKQFFSAQEAEEFEQRTRQRRADSQRRSPSVHPPDWLDYGTRVQPSRRTSLIVDPPDGRVPALTAHARARRERRSANQGRPAQGPEDRSLWERCLTGFNAGPPLNPGAYNNNIRIVVTPDAVVIVSEMVHQARVVWLDDRARLPADVRLWQGASRGHWDGDTLVVETTNFTAKTSFSGSGENLRLTERFRSLDEATLLYSYTVDDPESFVQPWSAEVIMERGGPMYEYACHEGNLGLLNMLKVARALDAGEPVSPGHR